jgi:hypothetical protein
MEGPDQYKTDGSDVHWLASVLQVWVEGFWKPGADGGMAKLRVFFPTFVWRYLRMFNKMCRRSD